MAHEKAEMKREVWRQIGKTQTVFLATVDGDQPRVRPVTLIHFDEKLWITTVTEDAKVRQIKMNHKVELSWYFGEEGKRGSLRFAGTAEIVEDREWKAQIADAVEWFNAFWKSVDDPGYTLLRISPEEVEYMRPGEMEIHKMRL